MSERASVHAPGLIAKFAKEVARVTQHSRLEFRSVRECCTSDFNIHSISVGTEVQNLVESINTNRMSSQPPSHASDEDIDRPIDHHRVLQASRWAENDPVCSLGELVAVSQREFTSKLGLHFKSSWLNALVPADRVHISSQSHL